MLDAEIARLEKARDLLAHSLLGSSRQGSRAKKSLDLSLEAAAEATDAQPLPPDEEVQVQVIKPRRSYGPRPRRARSTEQEGALRASVPAGPVFVASAAIRRPEETPKHEAAAEALAIAPPAWRVSDDRDNLLQRFMEMGRDGAAK